MSRAPEAPSDREPGCPAGMPRWPSGRLAGGAHRRRPRLTRPRPARQDSSPLSATQIVRRTETREEQLLLSLPPDAFSPRHKMPPTAAESIDPNAMAPALARRRLLQGPDLDVADDEVLRRRECRVPAGRPIQHGSLWNSQRGEG